VKRTETFMDENGYLVTREVSDYEEVEVAVPEKKTAPQKAAPKAKGAAGPKSQVTLGGWMNKKV